MTSTSNTPANDRRALAREGLMLGLLVCILVGALLPAATLAQELSAQEPTAQQSTAQETVRAGLQPDEAESPGDAAVLAPRIHNPGLFEKSLKAAAAATKQYGTASQEATPSDHDPAKESDLERIQRIGYRLALVSDFDKFPFTFGLVEMAVPNAFALPAGQIFITRGMLNLGLTDDQLAALLGHEIAHVTEEHFLQMRRRATLLNSLATLVTVGAIAASGSSSDDYYRGPGGYVVNDNSRADLAEATIATGAVISELLLRNYSRKNEDESDETGQQLAALAGFDPDGARQLMAKMNLRIPQDKSFGYWQTHPFFDERVLAAEARGKSLRAQAGPSEASVEAYRKATQETLLGFLERKGVKSAALPSTERGRQDRRPQDRRPPGEPGAEESRKGLDRASARLLEDSALRAWPQGPRADQIRVKRVRTLHRAELAKLSQSRDYGRLISATMSTIEEIRRYNPNSAALGELTQDLGKLRQQRNELLPVADKILDGGIYQTEFLESYLSNFPDSERISEVALQLGLAYSRLQREADAVRQFLEVWSQDPDSEAGRSAARGLENLAPLLNQLSALERLATQDRNPGLADAALRRLDQQASEFEELRNGSEYLLNHPEGLFTETVSARLETLADGLYREMRLYEEVGDSAKAIARANLILEHAPFSRAAQRLSRELADEEIQAPGD